MKVLENIERQKYRNIQKNIFDISADKPEFAILKVFNNVKKYTWNDVTFVDLYHEINSKFYNMHSEFCIATALEFEPIFLFDLKNEDCLENYLGLLFFPKSIGLDFLNPNAGIQITNEKIFFYNSDENWCLYSDRYNDEVILAWD